MKLIQNHSMIVVRSSGERTTDACVHFLKKAFGHQMPINVINERPFAQALKVCWQLGMESKQDYLITVDADVLVMPDIVNFYNHQINHLKDFMHLSAKAICALTNSTRAVGPRLYNTKYLSLIMNHLKESVKNHRPESEALKNAARTVRESNLLFKFDDVIALHDFGQWRRDLYRKGVFYNKKHQSNYRKYIDELRGATRSSLNYQCFFQGFDNSNVYQASDCLDHSRFPSFDSLLIEERPAFDCENWEIQFKDWIDTKLDL
jgi:hypothetical protein